MGGVCAKRSHIEARALDAVYYTPTDKGWEDASLFRMGHFVDGTVWWGTWRWSGWVLYFLN